MGGRVTYCKKPLLVGHWRTHCVLDNGHEGDCCSYSDVLRLPFITKPARAKDTDE